MKLPVPKLSRKSRRSSTSRVTSSLTSSTPTSRATPTIKIALKWDAATKTNAIKNLQRVSRPGLRQYASVADMPRVLNGLGIAILSTSKGIMTDAKARQENVGGEVLCYIY